MIIAVCRVSGLEFLLVLFMIPRGVNVRLNCYRFILDLHLISNTCGQLTTYTYKI
jgi:hypothetical protein